MDIPQEFLLDRGFFCFFRLLNELSFQYEVIGNSQNCILLKPWSYHNFSFSASLCTLHSHMKNTKKGNQEGKLSLLQYMSPN